MSWGEGHVVKLYSVITCVVADTELLEYVTWWPLFG